jgi:RNA methyltransferase, TrmH family
VAGEWVTFDIESTSNPRLKRLARLSDRRHRDEEGVFKVEGRRLVERAIRSGLTPVEVYIDGTDDFDWADPVTVRPDVLDRASYRKRSEGIIAVFPQYVSHLSDLAPSEGSLIIVVEGLEKPGNLGAILRTADAVGADAVIDLGGTVDRWNPNLLRSSTGACFTVPVVGCAMDELFEWARVSGIPVVAADPRASTGLWEADLAVPIALLVGAEDAGLSAAALAAADATVAIPMVGTIDSLNASVATAILAFEVARQRMERAGPPS